MKIYYKLITIINNCTTSVNETVVFLEQTKQLVRKGGFHFYTFLQYFVISKRSSELHQTMTANSNL
jgi:hypothetical protein